VTPEVTAAMMAAQLRRADVIARWGQMGLQSAAAAVVRAHIDALPQYPRMLMVRGSTFSLLCHG
jgi:hypothetical protein